MITENLSTLKIHKLTQEQYDRVVTAGRIDENALYLTPEEDMDAKYATTNFVMAEIAKAQLEGGDVDLSGYVTKDDMLTQISSAIKAIDYPVDSVNGKTGTVQLSANDVGALPLSGGILNDGSALSLTGNSRRLKLQTGSAHSYGSSVGNWANAISFYNNDGSVSCDGIGAFGQANTLNYIYIGGTYNNSALKIYTDSTMILNSTVNHGETLPDAGIKGRIFFKKVT